MTPSKVLVLLIFVVASLLPAKAANPDWPKSLTIGTASPGGVYVPYGRALAKLWTAKAGIPADAVATQGAAQNLRLLDLGGAQIAMTTMGIALQGWNGTGQWTAGKQFRNVRALFPMFDTAFHLVVLRRSGITTLAQLEKRSLGVGPRAGTSGTYVPDIMKILGIAAEVKYGALDDLASELLAGRYDAEAPMTGLPSPSVSAAETRELLTFIRLTHEQIDAVRNAMPELSPSTISSKVYRSLESDYDTFGIYNFAIGRADLADDLVYQLVKVVFENTQALAAEVPAALETIPRNVDKDTFLPLHPGAIRYYRERGIQIDPKLIPGT
jgi:TRAP transporter TAXI family solute receptor